MTTKFKQADHVLGSNLDDALIVTSTENESFYGMNKVATFIWELLENPTSPEEIIKQLLLKYEVEQRQCEQEVTAFFEEMHKANVIEML